MHRTLTVWIRYSKAVKEARLLPKKKPRPKPTNLPDSKKEEPQHLQHHPKGTLSSEMPSQTSPSLSMSETNQNSQTLPSKTPPNLRPPPDKR